jgi:uncharacterized membrane protein
MTAATPRTIGEYLQQLREALRDADPALVQDALYDAEDHLRSELADHSGTPEAELLAKIATSYGAPDEVADLYRDQEVRVERALRPPSPPPRRSPAGRFFGVAADPRAYAALCYMLIALPLGIFYFTWAVTGTTLSLGLSILIFGIVFAVIFFGTVRVLSFVEGRLVEVMLGERMPRRPVYVEPGRPLTRRIGAMFTDARTWTSLLYMVLMLPLGIVYFTIVAAGLSVSLGLIFAPIAHLLWSAGLLQIDADVRVDPLLGIPPIVIEPLLFVLGIVLLFGLLHVARGVARFQGALAKHLLVANIA